MALLPLTLPLTLTKARGRAFLQWLCGRPEIHIAVVCHSVFLKNMLKQVYRVA